jgi:alpha-L-rhamnosidase
VRDWADAARPDGNFTDTSPFVGVPYCGVGWAMVQPLLIERIYQHYGSQSLVEEQLPAAIRGLDLEASPPRRPARPFTGCKPAAAATISSCLHDHENVHQAI